MKTTLLRKLKKKFHIIKNSYGEYMVEGSSQANQKKDKDINEIRKWRRHVILSYARVIYYEYSVLRKKTFN